MKSLLVTTEFFNIGGLETHVAGEVACLAEEGFRIHLVVGSNTSDKMLPKEATSVTTGLVMGPAMTTAELIQTVESLRKIIREQYVECVHAHPFMSLVPSQIAAELEGIPFVVTLHGPASLSDCYGPLYDFILTSVILPKADMVVAVSQEVADLAAPYVDDARLCVLPNGVPVGIFGADLVEDCADGRWLLVSRLDIHKVVGIRDFIQKAAAAGLPGVLIVGDGDARGKLLSQLDVDGLSNYVEFLGARTDVAKLMRRAAGVAGMGRVIIEGLACSKPAVLVGYDGVKGVVTPDVFRVASATNFSGRKMPTISATEFSRQLSLTQRGTNELTDLVRSEYSDKAIWRKFVQKLDGLKTHGRSLLSDAYIKFASETNAPAEAYLHSHAWFEQFGRLAHSLKHFDQSVVANFYYTQKRYMDDRMVMQIASLNQAMDERDRQLAHFRDEAHSLFSRLNQLLDSRSWQLTRPLRVAARIVKHGLVNAIRSSASWRLTAPVRAGGTLVRKAIRLSKKNAQRAAFLAERLRTEGFVSTAKWVRQRLSRGSYSAALKMHPPFEVANLLNHLTNSPKIAVVPCAFQFDELANQRPINLAKFLSKKGYFVVFVAWQWNPKERLEKSGTIVHENVMQISLYQFLHHLRLFPKRSPKDSVFFVTFPADAFLEPIRYLRSRGFSIAYDIMDDWEEFAGVGQAPWYKRAVEDQIVLEADVVCGVSKPLVDKFLHLRTDAFVNGNGYSVDVLGKEAADIARNTTKKPGIRAGYFGHLTDSWFDWDLLLSTAESNPDIQFDVIGYGAPDHCLRAAERLPNVTYHGPVPPAQLSLHTRQWTVGLIPFKKGRLAAAVDPIKIYEYLYMGLPVVVTGIEHLATYHCTKVADDPQEFGRLIREQSSLQSHWPQEAVDQFLAASTWQARFETLLAQIDASEPVGTLYA